MDDLLALQILSSSLVYEFNDDDAVLPQTIEIITKDIGVTSIAMV